MQIIVNNLRDFWPKFAVFKYQEKRIWYGDGSKLVAFCTNPYNFQSKIAEQMCVWVGSKFVPSFTSPKKCQIYWGEETTLAFDTLETSFTLHLSGFSKSHFSTNQQTV